MQRYSYPEITERIVAVQGLKFIFCNFFLIKDVFSSLKIKSAMMDKFTIYEKNSGLLFT
jgi:hypothetical protein